jgi:hypothetical protein
MKKKAICNKPKPKPKSKKTKKSKKTINILSKNKNIVSVSGGGGTTIPIPIPIFNNEGSRPVIIQQPYETIQQPVHQPIKEKEPFYTLEDKPASLTISPEKK